MARTRSKRRLVTRGAAVLLALFATGCSISTTEYAAFVQASDDFSAKALPLMAEKADQIADPVIRLHQQAYLTDWVRALNAAKARVGGTAK